MSRATPEIFTLSRTTGQQSNPATIEQRANAFATSTTDCDSTLLLLFRDESGVRPVFAASGPGDSVWSSATALAHTLSARAEKIESLPDWIDEVDAISRMTVIANATVTRQAVVGVDPTEIARLLADRLRPGEWVGLSLREPTLKEEHRNSEWIGHRYDAFSHSQSRDARVVSMYAGSRTHREAKALLVRTAAAMHGFDLKVSAEPVSVWHGVRGWAATALGSFVGAGVASFVPAVSDLPGVGSSLVVALVALGVVAGVAAALRWFGVWATLAHRVYDQIGEGRLPVPERRRVRPKPPRDASTNPQTGKTVRAHPGDYPLHRSSFLVQPSIFVGIASPHGGSDSGAASAKSRKVPLKMQQRIGPLIGYGSDGEPAYLSCASAWSGVAVLGRPSSGKSVLIRSLFGWACMERNEPSGVPAATGANNTLIVFESKDYASVRAYQEWAAVSSNKVPLVDLADPNSLAIDLIGTEGTLGQRAEAWVNGLVYAFDDGEIQARSFDVLRRIYTGALCIAEDPSLVALIDGVRTDGSFNYYADVLIGNRGDDKAVALAGEVLGLAKRPESTTPNITEAAEALAPIFAGRTDAQRRGLVEAAQNKVSQLASMEHWWSPSRQKISWRDVLATEPKQRGVIINTGTSAHGVPVEEAITRKMTALIFYTLQRAIARDCQGWEAAGRSVSIFSDELSLLAGTSPEVILWLKDQGRSFGVRQFLATQRPEQLPPKVRSLILNFGTLVCFNQDAVATATEVASEMAGADGPVEPAEIMHLPDYNVMVRAYAGSERQPAFTAKTVYFESDRAAARSIQGYSPTAVVKPKGLPAPPTSPVLPPDAGPVALPMVTTELPVDDGFDVDLSAPEAK